LDRDGASVASIAAASGSASTAWKASLTTASGRMTLDPSPPSAFAGVVITSAIAPIAAIVDVLSKRGNVIHKLQQVDRQVQRSVEAN
jgi:hypothetical protein